MNLSDIFELEKFFFLNFANAVVDDDGFEHVGSYNGLIIYGFVDCVRVS